MVGDGEFLNNFKEKDLVLLLSLFYYYVHKEQMFHVKHSWESIAKSIKKSKKEGINKKKSKVLRP